MEGTLNQIVGETVFKASKSLRGLRVNCSLTGIIEAPVNKEA